jgi:hypothetical protein
MRARKTIAELPCQGDGKDSEKMALHHLSRQVGFELPAPQHHDAPAKEKNVKEPSGGVECLIGKNKQCLSADSCRLVTGRNSTYHSR